MTLDELAEWLKARRLDLHWSWTPAGEACLTAIRSGPSDGRRTSVWNGTAAAVSDAVIFLKASVEATW